MVKNQEIIQQGSQKVAFTKEIVYQSCCFELNCVAHNLGSLSNDCNVLYNIVRV